MSDKGTWIKLYRNIEKNEFYFAEKFTKSQAWIDLLIIANKFPKTFYVRGNEVRIKAGQIGRSIVTLADRWKWNERTVTKFLKTLENRGMIHYRSNSVTTIITIVNWKIYQGDTEQNTEQNAEQMQSRVQTNKKDKKEYKDKKRDISTSSNNSFKDLGTEEQELTATQKTGLVSVPKNFKESKFFEFDVFADKFLELNGCDDTTCLKYYGKFCDWKGGKVKLTEEGWIEEFKKWYSRNVKK